MSKRIIICICTILLISLFSIAYGGDDSTFWFYDTHHINGVESQPVVEHKMTLYDDILPTCVKRGIDIYKCTECNVTLRQETDVNWDVHENLSTNYYYSPNGHWKICKDCGAIVDPEPHEIGECFCGYNASVQEHKHKFERVYTSLPTCTTKGEYYLQCECGESEGTYYTSPTGHQFEEIILEKTNCHYPGTILKKCLTCGLEKKEQYKESQFIDVKYKTKNDTKHEVICGKCKKVLREEPHIFVSNSDSNYHWDECAKCGKIKNKAKHDFALKDRQVATIHSEGFDLYMCTECHAWQTRNIIPRLEKPCEHNYTTKYNEFGHWQECILCGDEIKNEDHKMVLDHKTAPKCGDPGEEVYKCTCGYTKGNAIPPTDKHDFETKYDKTYHWDVCKKCGKTTDKVKHDFDLKDHFAATTTSEGYDLYMCTEGCGASEKRNVIPKLDKECTHNYIMKSNDTYHWEVCTKCGNEINNKKHTFEMKDHFPATTTSEGYDLYMCTEGCGASEKRNVIPKLDKECTHNYIMKSNDTYHWEVCTKCGNEINNEKHTFDIKDHFAATTTSEGYDLYMCTGGCGASERRNIIPKLDKECTHNYVYKYGETSHYRKCTICGKEIDYADHNYKKDHTTAPTCGKAGEDVYKCVCGSTRGSAIPPTGQHNYVSKSDETNHWKECKVCGTISGKANHSYVRDHTTAPTCGKAGEDVFKCSCGKTKGSAIPPTGQHNYVSKSDETNHWKECKVCGAISGKANHSYVRDHTTAPTCGKAGEDVFKCSCGKTKGSAIPPTGQHNYVTKSDETNHWKECKVCGTISGKANHSYVRDHTTAPTCTKAGEDVFKCSCGKTKGSAIPPTGQHSYGGWTTTKAATCTSSGTEQRTCSMCGNKETRTIAAKGHSSSSSWSSDSSNHWHPCTRCGARIGSAAHKKVSTGNGKYVCATCGRFF